MAQNEKEIERSRLRLLSFNIQHATPTSSYREYLTHSWRQVLPNSKRIENLDAISELVSGFDMVALQEVDSGSLRSGFINQSRYIATHADLPYWFHQSNRKVGSMAYPGNGFLARFDPGFVQEHRLPGAIPGRGALLLEFGADKKFAVLVVHLALGPRSRRRQLQFLTELLTQYEHVIIMGDFNAEAGSAALDRFCQGLGLRAPTAELLSYPAWKPQRGLDHILISEQFPSVKAEAIDVPLSDHLPVAVTIELPDSLQQALHPPAADESIEETTAG